MKSEGTLKRIAEDVAKTQQLNPKEVFDSLVKSIAKTPQFMQQMIDSVAIMQEDWPMPAWGWGLFVGDIQRANAKYGWDLRVPETPGHLREAK